MTKHLTTKQVAKLRNVHESRVRAMLKQKKRHFPGAVYRECECGRKAWFIPVNDVPVVVHAKLGDDPKLTAAKTKAAIDRYEKMLKSYKVFCPKCGVEGRRGSLIAGYLAIACDACEIKSWCDIGGGDYEPREESEEEKK